MQDNEERDDSGGRDGRKKKDNYAANAADALNDESEARSATVIVATKTEDGGSTTQEQEQAGIDQGPDAFATYSDDDTRMLTLLGLDPNSNLNEGEQVDWRQLTGFTGLGRRNNNQDEGGNINEAGNGTTPRKTRLSFELHPDVFHGMLLEDLNLNDNGDAGRGQARRHHQQGQDQDDQH